MDKLTITTKGCCAIGTPNGLTFHRGYVELWRNNEKQPYARVWCSERRLTPEKALTDAMHKEQEVIAWECEK